MRGTIRGVKLAVGVLVAAGAAWVWAEADAAGQPSSDGASLPLSHAAVPVASPDQSRVDCNGNGIPDQADIALGTSADCQRNHIPDECDVAEGTSEDCNANGVPDECEPGNIDGVGGVNLDDYYLFFVCIDYGGPGQPPAVPWCECADLDDDEDVDLADFRRFQVVFGTP
jgi:hypothetical protein